MSCKLKTTLFAGLLLLGAAWLAHGFLTNCCTARQTPSGLESAFARGVSAWSVPSSVKKQTNPVMSSPEVVQAARRHFADHCASCHGNDGSGETDMGRNFYPRVPDMRLADTQKLSDGEIFYIIRNGIRWTGMPAWGGPADDEESWQLVWFIRHLPQITPDELRDMEHFNPKSAAEHDEEEEERKFLEGTAGPTAPPQKERQK